MTINWKLIGLNLLFWLLYIIIWGVRDMAYAPTFWDTLDGNLIGTAWYSIGVYLNLFLLLPRFLFKGLKLIYVLSIIVLVIAISYGTAQTYALHYLSVDVGTSVFFNSAGGVANTASDFLVVYGLSTCLFFINEWYIKERKLRELETQKLQAELNLLKGQINPHFLFNALNTVHVLIKKDQDLARQTLERFSDLLSHQIYEVNNEVIPLKNEIDNLSNYIHLQKMRFENQMEVKWKVNGKLSDLVISPMLFLNFVENAFKHGDNAENGKVMIEIRMSVVERRMDFSCSNSIVAGKKLGNVLGVGIANVKRRLELIYPERHELTIDQTENLFSVHLILKLDEV